MDQGWGGWIRVGVDGLGLGCVGGWMVVWVGGLLRVGVDK